MARRRLPDDAPKQPHGVHGPNRTLPEPISFEGDPLLSGLGDFSVPEAKYLRAWMEHDGDEKAIKKDLSAGFIAWAVRQPRIQEAIRKTIQAKLLSHGAMGAVRVLTGMVGGEAEEIVNRKAERRKAIEAIGSELETEERKAKLIEIETEAADRMALLLNKERRAAAVAVLNLAGIVAPKAPEAPATGLDKPLSEMSKSELAELVAKTRQALTEAQAIEGSFVDVSPDGA